MLQTLAVQNHRTLRDFVIPLGELNLITGANGSGKSNIYKALRRLAETAQGGVVASIAREGGLSSTLWAGPETISRAMRTGEAPIEGTRRQKPVSLGPGFASSQFSHAIDLGLPVPSESMFSPDPVIEGERLRSRTSIASIDPRGAGWDAERRAWTNTNLAQINGNV